MSEFTSPAYFEAWRDGARKAFSATAPPAEKLQQLQAAGYKLKIGGKAYKKT
jgi:hypothetical protein